MKANQMQRIKRNIPLHLMLLPGVVLMIIFAYIPMYGVVIAFQDFVPAKGLFGDQVWIGLDNFRVVFTYPKIWEVLQNTLWISIWKIILSVDFDLFKSLAESSILLKTSIIIFLIELISE